MSGWQQKWELITWEIFVELLVSVPKKCNKIKLEAKSKLISGKRREMKIQKIRFSRLLTKFNLFSSIHFSPFVQCFSNFPIFRPYYMCQWRDQNAKWKGQEEICSMLGRIWQCEIDIKNRKSKMFSFRWFLIEFSFFNFSLIFLYRISSSTQV